MKRKRRSFLSTSVKVYLSLNIQAEKDSGESGLLTIPLLSLNTLVMFLWSLHTFATPVVLRLRKVSAKMKRFIRDIHHRIIIIATLFDIGLKSLAYGLGVAL
jgi:hypothetical protein